MTPVFWTALGFFAGMVYVLAILAACEAKASEVMAKQWWHYISRLGWQRCTERDAMNFRGELGEGEKVACIDERIGLDKLAQMKRPVAMMHPKVLAAITADPDTAQFFVDWNLEIRQHNWLPQDSVMFIDLGAFEIGVLPY